MGWVRRFAPTMALALGGALAAQGWGQSSAVRVKVRQVDSLGNTLAEEASVHTDEAFTSVEAPERAGWRFTHWAVSPAQPGFANRDAWGRALDAVTVTPKDAEVTLTAVYADAAEDTDGDGVADAEERYWYGAPGGYDTAGLLAWDGASDTDGDGYTFAEELQADMNPLFPNRFVRDIMITSDSDILLYNPNSYQDNIYIVCSEPEGVLFTTYSGSAQSGTTITTEAFSPDTSAFAYWTVNGVRQTDAWGVTVNTATFMVGNEPIKAVAHCVDDAQERQAYYWYGKAVDPESDLDGDGYTFTEELQAGMNPVFPNRLVLGGVATGDSAILLYNPNEYPEVIIRSEPEGVFATEQVVLRPGQSHTTDTFSPDDRFAQWTRNGVRQADTWGRALDAITFVGDPSAGKVELTAHFVDDAHTRLSRYWYGVDDQDGASDTDGDGYTFAEELQAGMNPLFPNKLVLGGVAIGDGPTLEANLQWSIPVSAETPLSPEDADLLRGLLADRLGGVRAIRVEGTDAAILAGLDLGIVPATTSEDGTLTARFETPTLRIVAFDPQAGTARVRVIPADGATLAQPLATGVLQVRAAERLGEAMAPLEAEVDAVGYLEVATLGEAGLIFSLGRSRFIKVVVERPAAKTAASPTQDRQP